MAASLPFGRADDLLDHRDTTDWLALEGGRLRSFAEGTYLDAQTVDLTISRNNVLGPTLVDGFLLLSLLVHFDFARPLLTVPGVYGFNYGLDRVRFIEPVFVDERVRMKRHVVHVAAKSPTRVLVTRDVELERERFPDTPAMVARWLVLFVNGDAERDSS